MPKKSTQARNSRMEEDRGSSIIAVAQSVEAVTKKIDRMCEALQRSFKSAQPTAAPEPVSPPEHTTWGGLPQPRQDALPRAASTTYGSAWTRSPPVPPFNPCLLPLFDGTGSWGEFERLVDKVANYYQWADDDKCLAVVLNLRGRTSTFYGTLPSQPTIPYSALCAAMRQRFVLDCRSSYQLLRHRIQGPRESLPDFALELERLAQCAFSGMPGHMYDQILLQQFIDGMRETPLQGLVVSSRPIQLQEALVVAMRVQAQIGRTQGKPVLHSQVVESGNIHTPGRRRRRRGRGQLTKEAPLTAIHHSENSSMPMSRGEHWQ